MTQSAHAYRESARNRVEADVDLVLEVGGSAEAHEWASLVNVLLPSIELFIAFEGKIISLVLGFEE